MIKSRAELEAAPMSPKAKQFCDLVYICEPPCDSYCVCSSCCLKREFEAGYELGLRAALDMVAEMPFDTQEFHKWFSKGLEPEHFPPSPKECAIWQYEQLRRVLKGES